MIILQQTLRDFIFSAKWKVYFYSMQSCWAALPRGHTDTGVCTPVLEQEYTWHRPGTPTWCPPSLLGCILEDHWAHLGIHHYSGAKMHFCLMAQILLTPRLFGGGSPCQPLQLCTPGFEGKQITLVLGLTCLHSYSKPRFHIYNSFPSIFKQISHCWKNVKGLIWYVWYLLMPLGREMIVSSTSHHVSCRSENMSGEFTGFHYTWYMQMNTNQTLWGAQTNNFAYNRPKLMWLQAYLFFPAAWDGLRECGFASELYCSCDLHQRAGPEA